MSDNIGEMSTIILRFILRKIKDEIFKYNYDNLQFEKIIVHLSVNCKF